MGASLGACAIPHAIVILDSGIGWADIRPEQLPAGAALAGISDPAMGRNVADVAVSLGAGGRNTSSPIFTTAHTQRLIRTDDGRWRLPSVAWSELLIANAKAHAGSRPGELGTRLSPNCHVRLFADADRAWMGALVIADRNGILLDWQPSAAVADLRADAQTVMVVVPPASFHGMDYLHAVAARFPDVPLLYLSLMPSHVPDFGPVILLNHGGPGLLASAQTHWRGVISASDVAPLILMLADVAPEGPTVQPPTVTPHPHAAAALVRLAAQARVTYRARASLSITWGALLACGALLLLIGRTRLVPYLRGWVFAGWVGPALLVLVLPPFWFLPRWALLLAMILIWGVTAYWLMRRPPLTAWGIASLIGAGALFVTAIGNGHFARQPFLGMAIVSGHRYYGLGNEGMGVMLILLSLLVGRAILRWPHRAIVIIPAVFGVTTLVLSVSCWGANWGGAMAALLTGFLYLGVHYWPGVRWWHFPLAIFAIAAAGALIIAALTLVYPMTSSHTGALGWEIVHHGFSALGTMIARKVAFAMSIWRMSHGWVMVLAGLTLAAIIVRLRLLPQAMAAPQPLHEAVWVAWGSAILAGLINDNGITLTALMWLTAFPAVAQIAEMIRSASPISSPTPVPQCESDSPY